VEERKAPRGGQLLALTVDVEPDWGIAGCQAAQQVLPALLDMLQRHSAGATLFVVAQMLPVCRELLREAAKRCEIASHGLTHRRLDRLPPEERRRELLLSRMRLSEELDTEVSGIRAPFLRVPEGWLELVGECGYRYDSSRGRVYPSWRNVPAGSWRPVEAGDVVELPPTTLRPGMVPFSLTYLRLGAPVTEALVPRGEAVFYMHLHELASPALARRLPLPLRWALRRRAGEPAWRVLERLLRGRAGRVVSCRALLQAHGLL